MSALNERIQAFDTLGKVILQYREGKGDESHNAILHEAGRNALAHNSWFSKESVDRSLAYWQEVLVREKISEWLQSYPIHEKEKSSKVAVIMAGNIPLVGFHDFLCVLLVGDVFVGKLSSQDLYLLPALAEILCEIEADFKPMIRFEEKYLNDFDAVIATGSDNTSRYFEYYFGKYPHVFRGNRNSIAILNGKESTTDYKELAKDIFYNLGLGCRNVSKIFVPVNYDFSVFFKAIQSNETILNHNKYANNYEYNKSIFLVNSDPHLDNGFLLLKESENLGAAVSILNFEYYQDIVELKKEIKKNEQKIQCVVGNKNIVDNMIPFGESQYPKLSDYADGVDVIQFLCHSF